MNKCIVSVESVKEGNNVERGRCMRVECSTNINYVFVPGILQMWYVPDVIQVCSTQIWYIHLCMCTYSKYVPGMSVEFHESEMERLAHGLWKMYVEFMER